MWNTDYHLSDTKQDVEKTRAKKGVHLLNQDFFKDLFMLFKCHSVSTESSHSKGQITEYRYINPRTWVTIFFMDIYFLIIS